MRTALSGLTVRGRAFLAAGLAALVCAVVLDQPSLASAGALVLVLPILSLVALALTPYRVSLVRDVQPAQVSVGEGATVRLSLHSEGRVPRGTLLLDDQLPYALGARPRLVVRGVRPGWRRELTYPVRSDVRGRHLTGPLTIRVSDPFGLVELGRTFRTSVALTVSPRAVPLPSIGLEGADGGAGDERPRAFAVGSSEDVTVREYRRGDDLRRVHWRSSARTGELMVRREEHSRQRRATVVLDNRRGSHRGSGPASSFETAVAMTASIVAHLADQGCTVRLLTADGAPVSLRWHDRDPRAGRVALLHDLALVELVGTADLTTTELQDGGAAGVLIAVLGRIDESDRTRLRSLARHAGTRAAIALDVDGWGPARAGESGLGGADAVASLRAEGWRAALLGAHDHPAQVWGALRATVRSAR